MNKLEALCKQYKESTQKRFSSTLLKKCDIDMYNKYLVDTPTTNFRIYQEL